MLFQNIKKTGRAKRIGAIVEREGHHRSRRGHTRDRSNPGKRSKLQCRAHLLNQVEHFLLMSERASSKNLPCFLKVTSVLQHCTITPSIMHVIHERNYIDPFRRNLFHYTASGGVPASAIKYCPLTTRLLGPACSYGLRRNAGMSSDGFASEEIGCTQHRWSPSDDVSSITATSTQRGSNQHPARCLTPRLLWSPLK